MLKTKYQPKPLTRILQIKFQIVLVFFIISRTMKLKAK